MEYWDAYDKYCHKVDEILVRDETIPKGMYHLVSEVLVRHIDQTYLITKRSANKGISPLTWEASAGGSAIINETALVAAQRELWEECGITSSKWYELGMVTDHEVQTHYCGFLCIYDQEKTKVKLQKEETIAYDWISEEKLQQRSKTREYRESHKKRLLYYLKKSKELKLK